MTIDDMIERTIGHEGRYSNHADDTGGETMFGITKAVARSNGYGGPMGQLTRDHIIPRSRGGNNEWTNVATACSRCNHQKGARTPEEANMPLLAVPFRPNLYERFYLMNRRILADQMDFLSHHFSDQRNWL